LSSFLGLLKQENVVLIAGDLVRTCKKEFNKFFSPPFSRVFCTSSGSQNQKREKIQKKTFSKFIREKENPLRNSLSPFFFFNAKGFLFFFGNSWTQRHFFSFVSEKKQSGFSYMGSASLKKKEKSAFCGKLKLTKQSAKRKVLSGCRFFIGTVSVNGACCILLSPTKKKKSLTMSAVCGKLKLAIAKYEKESFT
jgi:hypothetical protein